MIYVPNYGDKRQTMNCAYCGGDTSTQDHVPSKVLLDEPFPDHLPIVPCCNNCNKGFSLDEEYIACLIECAVSGSIEKLQRAKIARVLSHSPALAKRIQNAKIIDGDSEYYDVEEDRMRNVLRKLAAGHSLYELNTPLYDPPHSIVYKPYQLLKDNEITSFESEPVINLWPEVGSRAMIRIASNSSISRPWIIVQPGRYRYLAYENNGIIVRIVISEYLACEVIWKNT